MSESASVINRVDVLGKTFQYSGTTTGDAADTFDVTLAAAKTGTLSTRTDANTGTLTMTGGHGITTGARLDLYWTGGQRRGVTVGTVNVNSVPIDLGAGTDLPAQDTAITAQVPDQEDIVVTGANATLIVFDSTSAGVAQVVLTQSNDTEALAAIITATADAYLWDSTGGFTNPITGVAVTKAYLSHGDSAATARVRGVILHT